MNQIMPRIGNKNMGGAATTILRKNTKVLKDLAFSRDVKIDVPCGDCNACCKGYQHIRIDPRFDKYPELFEERIEDGQRGLFLPKKENGECQYLTKEVCSIYAKRPSVCETYDCRLFAVARVIPSDQHQTPAPLPGSGDSPNRMLVMQ